MRWLFAAILAIPIFVRAEVRIAKLDEKAQEGVVELRGVSGDVFDPSIWEKGKLNWVADARHPMMEPREGAFRNIYAPSAVEVNGGWRLFYGGWDGVASGNDRIYSAMTSDWLEIKDRKTVIEHGVFQHVCNVSAVEARDGSFMLACTAYPDANGLNKPASFVWKVGEAAREAKRSDGIMIVGYEKFAQADMNGMNVIVREDGEMMRLYFGNFRDFGKTYRASSEDGKRWTLDGKVLDGNLMVNDVKRLRVRGEWWYLMGLHHNGDELVYSLSRDGMKFPPARQLFKCRGETDRFMVAMGWVVSDERVLGVLYGAGAKGSLDQNRIFARWLQKRVVWVGEDGTRVEAKGARGPDRVEFSIEGRGRFEVLQEDGETTAGTTEIIELKRGEAYSIDN